MPLAGVLPGRRRRRIRQLPGAPAEAFGLLSRYSQNTNQRVRKISAALVQGRIAATRFRPPADPSV